MFVINMNNSLKPTSTTDNVNRNPDDRLEYQSTIEATKCAIRSNEIKLNELAIAKERIKCEQSQLKSILTRLELKEQSKG